MLDGAAGQSLGVLKPLASTQVTLSLIALETGTRKITGLQLLDVASNTLHEVGPLTDVCVVPPPLSPGS